MVRTMALEITVPNPKRSAKLPRVWRRGCPATWLPPDSTTTGAVLLAFICEVPSRVGYLASQQHQFPFPECISAASHLRDPQPSGTTAAMNLGWPLCRRLMASDAGRSNADVRVRGGLPEKVYSGSSGPGHRTTTSGELYGPSKSGCSNILDQMCRTGDLGDLSGLGIPYNVGTPMLVPLHPLMQGISP